MNNVKKQFSIRDLEHFSGIKAHTIRIWEKRYNLLSPDRTSTNIRTYDLASLQKLLNISLLYNQGYKISKIAELREKDIPQKVREIVAQQSSHNHAINSFKVAMLNFDQALFTNTYNGLLAQHPFREVFHNIFIPLLNELGLLWQTDTITPAHEHFITNLIKQKIIGNTEKLQRMEPTKKEKVFVTFLPENEIHEIGLLFINYEIVLHGYKLIHLGQSVPLDILKDILGHFDQLRLVSYFTVAPVPEKLNPFIEEFKELTQGHRDVALWLLGQQTKHIDAKKLPDSIRVFCSIDEIVTEL